MEKSFLLGVGCQKGGTTWLYRYLRSHPNVSLGFTKEHHVFDVLYLDKTIVGSLELNPVPLSWAILSFHIGKWRRARRLATFRQDPERYFDYFQELANASASINVVGDITPTYAMLPPEGFRFIRDGLQQRGFDVKVLFLMRDPVKRCISAMRMATARKRLPADARALGDEASHLKSLYATVGFRKRTAYEQTIQSLERVFEKESILYLFYESLFQETTTRAIANFLNLPFMPADFNRRFNSSQQSASFDRELVQEVFEFYRPTYEFIASRFGERAVRENWSTYRELSPRKIA